VAAQVSIRAERQVERGIPGRRSGRPGVAAHREIPRHAAVPAKFSATQRWRCDAGVHHPWRLRIGHAVQVGQAGHLARSAAHQVELGRRHFD
jgi:hypothetical protein